MSEREGRETLLDVPASPAPGRAPDARGRARFRTIDRCQMQFRTVDVDRLVEPDHVVRAIWELSGKLDWSPYAECVKAVEGGAGRPAWDPRLLACIWVYAYARGIGSARAVARQMEFDPAIQWLAGLETVNYHTLADFRTRRRDVEDLFVQLLGVLSAEGLVALQRITHDGTKIRACASSGSFHREARIREHLAAARAQVEAIRWWTSPGNARPGGRRRCNGPGGWRQPRRCSPGCGPGRPPASLRRGSARPIRTPGS